MFKSLYSKLAVILAVLFSLVGLSLVFVALFSTDLYQQEINQKLNAKLAEQIVKEKLLIQNQNINNKALKEVFSMLMVVNPSLEIYLLDTNGQILAFSAPLGKIKRKTVNIQPIKELLYPDAQLPILGDDPRDPTRKKIFSVARIPEQGHLQGYLYIILGGESYDSVVQKLKGSYILTLSSWIIVASLLFALITGLLLFAALTGRLKELTRMMEAFKAGEKVDETKFSFKRFQNSDDEISHLGITFKQMAEKIDDQMEQLIQSDTMRRDLIANISHDLRTPLATLQGYIETLLLKKNTLRENEQEHYLKVAINHCDHLNRLVDRLLELAKLESYETQLTQEPFNLSELVHDVIQKFELKAKEKKIQLIPDFDAQLPFVTADIGLIERVFDNLIENALRFTPENGNIIVTMNVNKNNIDVRISDSGCGISKDVLPSIFDRFFQLDKSRDIKTGHSGLGLAITKKILELHQSNIKVESEIEQGTCFSFSMKTSA